MDSILCGVILIVAVIILAISIVFFILARSYSLYLQKRIASIKDYEILIHGDDMFLIPEKKMRQLYGKYVERTL